MAGSQPGHLPWPLVQWALTSPLGILVLAVVDGLLWIVPFGALLRLNLTIVRPVDVTDLPLAAWPRSFSHWSDPTGATWTDQWLGRSQPQRAWNLLALALAAMLLPCLLAAALVVIFHPLAKLACSAAGCPPDFGLQLLMPPVFLGQCVAYLGHVIWVASVERRCGVWFRVHGESRLGTYIRRPGVTPEVAAALQRSTSDSRPLAQLLLFTELAFIPFFLLWSGAVLLSTWLATQWIPG